MNGNNNTEEKFVEQSEYPEKEFINDNNEELTIKERLSYELLNKENPEMITKVIYQDVPRLAILKSLVSKENILRERLIMKKGYNIGENVLTDVIREHLVLLVSVGGWRATQTENVVKQIVDDSLKQGFSIGAKIDRILGKGA